MPWGQERLWGGVWITFISGPVRARVPKPFWATSPTSRWVRLLDRDPCAALRVGLRAMASLPRTN